MSLTAGCLNVFLNEEKYTDIFSETFAEVVNPKLSEPMEAEEVKDCFVTEENVLFTLDAEPIFEDGHGTEYIQKFLMEFIKKAPDVILHGDYFSDWDNCCDVAVMKFEYKDGKLSLMRLFAEFAAVRCEYCDEEIELEDMEADFKGKKLQCPHCNAAFELDGENFRLSIGDMMLCDGEWVFEMSGAKAGEDFSSEENTSEENTSEENTSEENTSEDSASEEAPAEEVPETEAEPEAEEVPEAEAEPETEAEPEKEAEPEAEAEVEPEKAAEPEKRKKSKWWIIPLVIALLAVGAAAVQYFGVYDIIGFVKELFGK